MRHPRLPKRLIRRETVIPARLSPEDRQRFAARVFDIHAQVFSGVSFDRFLTHVIDPPAERTAVQLYFGEAGALVGYCGFHRYPLTLDGRRSLVLRAEAGLLPAYRGHAAGHWFGMIGALREKLRHPFTPVYYFGTLVHPSSYRFFCKYFKEMFPRAHGRDGADLARKTIRIAESFPDSAVDPSDPLVRDVGWVTIEGAAERPPERGRTSEDVRFFLARNPGYRQGRGLCVLVPVTFANVGRAILRLVAERTLGAIRRRHVPVGTLDAEQE